MSIIANSGRIRSMSVERDSNNDNNNKKHRSRGNSLTRRHRRVSFAKGDKPESYKKSEKNFHRTKSILKNKGIRLKIYNGLIPFSK